MNRPAVFLDRDGTMIEEVNYLRDPDQVVLIGGVGPSIARLNDLGIPVVVVTNQAGVARNYFTEDRVVEVHRRLDELLWLHGARIDGYYVCPHHPTHGSSPYRAACDCRKPRSGLLRAAAADHRLDLARSFMIGDKLSDLEAGANAGCATILVRTGYGATWSDHLCRQSLRLCTVAEALPSAIDHVIPLLIRSSDPTQESARRPVI